MCNLNVMLLNVYTHWNLLPITGRSIKSQHFEVTIATSGIANREVRSFQSLDKVLTNRMCS